MELENLRRISQGVQYELTGRSSPISVTFYPYTGLRNTLRERGGRIYVRLSDLLEDAPSEVLTAIVTILFCKLYGRRIPPRVEEVYRRYVSTDDFQERTQALRRRRGRKEVYHPRGRVFDLSRMYDSLNHQYFEGRLEIDLLGWGRRRARTRLGHWDPAHRAIVLNPRLDNPLVPEYVVAYILYHEMLHAHFGVENSGTRRRIHHRRFQQAERKFPDLERARDFIDRELGGSIE